MGKHVLTPEDGSKRGKKSKRGPSLVTALKKILSEKPEIEDQLMTALVQHAMDGSPAHMKLAMEYLDGKVKEQVEHSGPDGGPIENINKI